MTSFPTSISTRITSGRFARRLPQIHQPNDRSKAWSKPDGASSIRSCSFCSLPWRFANGGCAHQRQAPPLPTSSKIDARITRLFPFELTAGQRQAIDEIAADMARPFPMNRLLQGDVGSGKTVVAMYAMLLAVAHGYQAALMAPDRNPGPSASANAFDGCSPPAKSDCALLTGSLTPAERREVLEKIAAGEVDVVIGTHAVTHAVAKSGVEFKKLGLVVIDEQHKFGVRQRAALKKAGVDPHYLVMTATPIPRTVGMTLFGDLDVSTLREPPPGRQTVHSYLAGRRAADAVVAFLPPEARRRPAGLCHRAARRRSRSHRSGQRAGDVRNA